jgi:hypothetical protein
MSQKLIMREGAEIYDIWLEQNNARPHTSATTTDAIAHCDLQSYHTMLTAWICL